MSYNDAKNALLTVRHDVRHLTRAAFAVIVRDRETARKIAEDGGDVSEFYTGSETQKTDFYKKNGGAYCALLEILSGAGC